MKYIIKVVSKRHPEDGEVHLGKRVYDSYDDALTVKHNLQDTDRYSTIRVERVPELKPYRYIIDVMVDEYEGEGVALGTELRHFIEETWGAKLADEEIGIIYEERPHNTTREEFEASLKRRQR